eukprot:COSAG02_NODE_4728_length_5045_cov_9.058835_7_plen_218_part_00
MRVLALTLSLLCSYGAADYTECDVSSGSGCSCLGIDLAYLAPTGGAISLVQEGGGHDPASFLLSLCYPISAADRVGCQNTSVGTSFLRKANPNATGQPKCTYLGDTASMSAEYATVDGAPALNVQYSHLDSTGSGDAGLSRVLITFTQGKAVQPSNVTQVNDTYYELVWPGLRTSPQPPTPPPPAPVHGCVVVVFSCCLGVMCMTVAAVAGRWRRAA